MATFPTAASQTAGNRLRANDWNAVVAYLDALKNPPGASGYRNTALSLTSGTTTLVPLDAEDYDRDSMHSTSVNTSRIVVNTDGRFHLTARLSFAANGSGIRAVDVRKNAGGSAGGGSFVARDAGPPAGTGVTQLECNMTIQLVSGDYLEMFATQTSGGALGLDYGIRLCHLDMVFGGTT